MYTGMFLIFIVFFISFTVRYLVLESRPRFNDFILYVISCSLFSSAVFILFILALIQMDFIVVYRLG